MKIESYCGGCGAKVYLEDRSVLNIGIEFNKWLKLHEKCLGIGGIRRSAQVPLPVNYGQPENDPD